MTEEAEFTSFNPINETYIEIAFVGNATIMPPNATNTINATETGNITLNIQPNGVNFAQGQGLLVTEEGDNGAQEKENATTTFVELSRVGPGDTGSGTGVVFFNTNSTGELAFLDNMLAIYQHEMYPGVDTIREWEWKGGTLPLETGGAGARILQGVAVALVPVSVRIARDLFPPAKFPYAQGMILSMYQGGSAIGLVLGAAVVYFAGWQGVFLSAIPFAFLFLFLLWKFIPKDS